MDAKIIFILMALTSNLKSDSCLSSKTICCLIIGRNITRPVLAGKRSWGHREPAQHRHQGGVAKDDNGHGQGHRPVGTCYQVHDGDYDDDGDGGGDHENGG